MMSLQPQGLRFTPPLQRYSIAFLLPHESPAMAHYAERIAAFLYVLLPNAVEVKTINTLPYFCKEELFGKRLQEETFDFYMCIGLVPGRLFSAVSQAGFTKKPGMIVSDQELTAQDWPANIMNLCMPNHGDLLAEVLLFLFPETRVVLLCGSRYSLAHAADLKRVRAALTSHSVTVKNVPISKDGKWQQFFEGYAPHSVVAVTAFEPRMFQCLSSIVSCARKNKIFTMANSVFAIHEGVDLAFGSPETVVFRYACERIILCLRERMMANEVLPATPSLHCNSELIAPHKNLRRRIEQLTNAQRKPIKVHIHANKEARR